MKPTVYIPKPIHQTMFFDSVSKVIVSNNTDHSLKFIKYVLHHAQYAKEVGSKR